MFDGMVVGAYAASPAHGRWDPRAEEEFFAGLVATPGVGALELPWLGSIHPHDGAWLRSHFPAELGAIITDIPHTMDQIGANPAYGLASVTPEGRRAAVENVARLRDDVRRFHDAQGRKAVGAVELHSAPRGAEGSRDALDRSLTEIASWEWGGVQLVIEHCDAWREGQAPEKGFLDLDTEMDAIARSGAPVGVSLNWGRSVIEGRSPDTAVEHARIARERGLLRGFIASGAADVDTVFGPAWIDAHLPFALTPTTTPHGLAGSLMTEERVTEVLRAAGQLDWRGVKVSARPGDSIADRVALVAESIALLAQIEASLDIAE